MKVLELCRGAKDTYFVLYFPKDFPIHSGIFDASQKIDINCKQQICNKEMPKGKNKNRSLKLGHFDVFVATLIRGIKLADSETPTKFSLYH